MSKTKQHYLHAIKVAIIREDKEFEGITLPTPQKTGTGFQRQTYAKQQAEVFYAKHFEQTTMKNSKEVQGRIKSLSESLMRTEENIVNCHDDEEIMELSQDVEVLKAKINSLQWVLN